MIRLTILVSTLLTGCYNYIGLEDNLPSPFEAIESTHGCLGPWTGDRPLSSAAAAHNEQALKALFKAHHLVNSDKDFCERFGGIPIHIEAADLIPCGDGTLNCWGRNDSAGIHLESHGRALAHELIHTLELEHWIFDTNRHPRWTEKGYYAIAREYESLYDPEVMP